MDFLKTRNLLLILCIGYVRIFAIFGCGNDKKSTDEATPTVVTPPTQENKYTGSIFINDLNTPAAEYQLFLLNHTNNSFSQLEVNRVGKFSLPIRLLRRFEVYSIHVVDDSYRYVAPITIDGVNNFIFDGSNGGNFGVIIINRDTFGVVDTTASTTDLTAPNGLESGTNSVGLEDFSAVSQFSSVKVGASLFVYDHKTLLDAFYRSAANPLKYQLAIKEWSGFRISAQLSNPSNKTMSGGVLTNAGKVLRGGNILINEVELPRNQPTWISKNYNFTMANNSIDTTIYPQGIARENEFLTFDLVYYTDLDKDQTTTYNFLGQLGLSLSMPPLITGMNQGNSNVNTIDYSSDILGNGLTVPFCRISGDVYLELSAPTAFGTSAITYDDFTEVRVKLEYYYDLNGILTLADIETNPDNSSLVASDYPIGHNIPFENSALSYAKRSWDPHSQTLLFTFKSTGTIGVHNLQLFNDIFISTIGSLDDRPVTQTKLRISYDGPKHRSGIVTIFKACQ